MSARQAIILQPFSERLARSEFRENLVRAAHTLAGISGTTGIKAVQQLAKAFEVALERLVRAEGAPTDEQRYLLLGLRARWRGCWVRSPSEECRRPKMIWLRRWKQWWLFRFRLRRPLKTWLRPQAEAAAGLAGATDDGQAPITRLPPICPRRLKNDAHNASKTRLTISCCRSSLKKA